MEKIDLVLFFNLFFKLHVFHVMLSAVHLERTLNKMVEVVKKKNREVSLEEIALELTKPQNEIRSTFYLLAELGNASVTKEGKLLFPEDFELGIKNRYPWKLKIISKGKQYILAFLRLFFGIGLFLSIALVGITLLIILFIILFSKGNNRNRSSGSSSNFYSGGGGGGNIPYFYGYGSHLLLRELLWFSMWTNPMPIYYPVHHHHYRTSVYPSEPNNNPPPPPPQNNNNNHRDLPEDRNDNREQKSILTDIFRFLFGDSFNSKEDHKLRCLKSIGYYIKGKSFGPVIKADEVKLYLDDYILNTQKQGESYMLPVLRCFNGNMEASSDGESLFYVFPDLSDLDKPVSDLINSYQTSMATKRINIKKNQDDSTLYMIDQSNIDLEQEGIENPPILETSYEFFYTNQTVGLAIWNFIQVVILGIVFYLDIDLLAQDLQVNASILYAIIYTCKYLYWYLLAYAIFFILFPLGRYFYIKWLNSQIKKRNHQRNLICKPADIVPTINL